jgi:dTMP kinase
MQKNLFIALEGIDGSGKSTQVKLLAENLVAAGHKVYTTFEPTDGHIGKLLRSILKGTIKADNKAIAGLFLADRLDHLLNEENGLVKKMAEGYTVITDRYYFSSYAYHSVHMDLEWVIACNSMCAQILRPDVNVFIDVAPEESMRRITANREVPELYETMDMLKNVREKYQEAFRRLAAEEKIVTVNGNTTIELIADDIWAAIQGAI